MPNFKLQDSEKRDSGFFYSFTGPNDGGFLPITAPTSKYATYYFDKVQVLGQIIISVDHFATLYTRNISKYKEN